MEISPYLSNFSKEATNEQTDRQTRNVAGFGNSVQISMKCLTKISGRYIIQNRRYPYICLISVRK